MLDGKKEMKKTKWSGLFLMLMHSRIRSISLRTSKKNECEGAIIEIMSFLVPGSRGYCALQKRNCILEKRERANEHLAATVHQIKILDENYCVLNKM